MMSSWSRLTGSLLSLCFFCSGFFGSSALAVTGKEADAKLAKMIADITTAQQDSDDYEKLQSLNDEMLKYLKTVIVQPAVMSDPLKAAAKSGLTVLTSDDKKIRCYSWDTLTGGTMHFFYSLIAYDAGNNKLKTLVLNPTGNEGDPGSTFEDLDTVKTSDGKTVYLVRDLFIGSGMSHGRTISAYVIANGKLTKYPFFQTKKRILNAISFAFGEYDERACFELSRDKKTLKVPLIKEPPEDSPSSGIVTGKYLTYSFNGSKYVYQTK